MKQEHPAKYLESHLCILFFYLRTRMQSEELNQALHIVLLHLERTANRISRAPTHRGALFDAKTTTHDFMVHLIQLADRGYEWHEPYFPWLHKAFTRWCLSAIRYAGVRRTQPLPESLRGNSGNPCRIASDRERRRHVLSATRKLPFELRVALIGQYWRRRTACEAADRKQVSTATINRLRSAGREALLRELSEGRGSDAA